MKQALLVFAAAITLTACAGDSEGPPRQSSTTTTTSDSATMSSRQATAQSEAAVRQSHADQFISGVKIKVEEVPANDTDGRLEVIITAYCTIEGTAGTGGLTRTDINPGLSKLYRDYWRAGGKWNVPLEAAIQQTGACPTPVPPARTGEVAPR